MSELVPQPQGGAIHRGWGHMPQASAKGVTARALRKQIREFMADRSLKAAERLWELCNDEDPKVSIVAIKEFNERLFGKAEQGLAQEGDGAEALSLTHLSAPDRQRLAEAMRIVFELTGRGAVTIEGDVGP